MDANPPVAAEPAVPAIDPQIRTVLLCDLADSTALVERIGDRAAACLMQQHDRLVRQLLREHGGQEIDKSDGFLALFDHPSHAVDFALDYQRDLRALGNAEGCDLRARVGIHVGDVLTWRSADADISRGAKPVNVEGLAKPVAARLMQLAEPGQTLLSGVAFSLAVRAGNPALHAGASWCGHGRYRFKGVPEPVQVHEVGEPGIAPLRAPPSADKAWRDVPLWRRPAVLAAQAAGLLAVAAIVWMTLLRATPEAVAFRERDWVVVGSLNNLTGDPRFDGALETALRISLEQSRHVNVLPDLRVRDTLQRMGRAPDSPVDRVNGSEIALREGARAVLLPTVAEVGGRVRMSLEVVDPTSQSTVFAQSYDGLGAESVLASVNQVSIDLRAHLGETLKAIEQSSEPVERATSPSLDALRAYTLGNRAVTVGNLGDARQHFGQAITLDPDFSLARVGLARIYVALSQWEEAIGQVRLAESQSDRLSARERLYVQAWLATLEEQRDHIAKWKALADLYPDFHPAAINVALFSWYANQFAQAAVYAERASAPQSAIRAHALYILGIAKLGLGDLDDALVAFGESRALGSSGRGVAEAAAHAVLRRFEKAREVLGKDTAPSPVVAHAQSLMALAVAMDEGSLDDARIQASALRARTDASDEPLPMLAAVASLAASHHMGDIDVVRAYGPALADRSLRLLDRNHANSRESFAMAALFAGFVSARVGETEIARRVLSAVDPISEQFRLGHVEDMLAILSAQLLLLDDRPEEAVRQLIGRMSGQELWLVHAMAAQSYLALGRQDDAMREFEWLTEHRGMAYAERSHHYLLLVESVSQLRNMRIQAARAAASVAGGKMQ